MKLIKEELKDYSKYDEYLINHISSVQKAYDILIENNIIKYDKYLEEQIKNHDKSKYSEEEYDAYYERFYGKNKNNKDDDLDFKYAWLHHQHNNPHHWQYWCLLEDNGGREYESLEMPYNYVVEMICDWLSFSITKEDLTEIHK